MENKLTVDESLQAIAQLHMPANSVEAKILLQHAEVLAGLKDKIKLHKNQKNEIASRFKKVVTGSAEHNHLIERMQIVSVELKELERQYKLEEEKVHEVAQNSQLPEVPLTPPFVTVPPQKYPSSWLVRELTVEEWARWETFLTTQDNTSAYHQGVWANIIAKSFHRPTRIWAALSTEGEILGGLPLTFFDSKLFGRFAVSIPYFNYGGVVSSYINVARDLIAQAQTVCEKYQLSHVEIRTMQAELGANASNKKVSMVLRLPASETLLDEQLGAKVRAQYKKAEAHDPKIRFGKLELLDDFYRVFARNMRDLGTPVYSRQWFANILQAPGIAASLAVVYVAGKPVSAGFLVGYRRMLEIPWASTIKEANALNTNMWMYRQILGYAIREGYSFFDFGRSTRDAGTYKFKKQWGAQAYTHYWYTIVSAGTKPPELNPDNPKFKLMIAVWQRLPVWLTRLIGPPIVANLP